LWEFENRMLRIFRPKTIKVAGDWRTLCNKELHNLYASPNIIRVIKSKRMKFAGYVALMGQIRRAYKILVGKPEHNKPLGRPRCRWEDNIRMDLREVGWGVVDWIHMAQDKEPVPGSCGHCNETSGSIKGK
jgi:hypothetical protein